MRLNKYVALATGLSRRAADSAIQQGDVQINGQLPQLGQSVSDADQVSYRHQPLSLPASQTVMLHKPVGYICSRNGQGGKTIYELLPQSLHDLKPVGRLDKDSSGLLLLTNDGTLHQQLTHPSHQKQKVYELKLNKPLTDADKTAIEQGIALSDGPSQLQLDGSNKSWRVSMHEGRNRQIRRTFDAIGYKVIKLHRTTFGNYTLPSHLASGAYQNIF